MVREINPINLGLAGEQRAEMSSSLRSLDDRLLFICGLRFADYLKRLSISVLISISLFLFLLPPARPPSLPRPSIQEVCQLLSLFTMPRENVRAVEKNILRIFFFSFSFFFHLLNLTVY